MATRTEIVEDDVKREGGSEAVHEAEELDPTPPLGMRRDDLSGGTFGARPHRWNGSI